MDYLKETIKNIPSIEASIHYTFKNKDLLLLAFAHRSFVNETKLLSAHNERLEFLGDSVLGLLVASFLYETFADTAEGELSVLRARLVEASSCVEYIQDLNIGQFLLLGKGERSNNGKGRFTILSDLFEAIIGAIYLDGGLEAASDFLFQHFGKKMSQMIKNPSQNWKALLQDFCQRNYQSTPHYKVLSEIGPDHQKEYEVVVLVENRELGRGKGSSKKIAQQSAAEDACIKNKLI